MQIFASTNSAIWHFFLDRCCLFLKDDFCFCHSSKYFIKLFWRQFSELIVAKNCSSWFIRRYGSVSYLGHWRCSHFFPRRFQKICNPAQEKLFFLFFGESIVLFVCLFIVFVSTHFFLFRIRFNQENFGELWNQFFFIHPGIF